MKFPFLRIQISLLILVLNVNTAFSQSNQEKSIDDIKAVVNNLFKAMAQTDTVLLKSCFSENGVIQTIVSKPEGNAVRTDLIQNFVNSIGKQTKGALDERIEFGPIQTEGQMATVWTPYNFYFNGKFSHKGVNSFQLVRFKEGWKIQYLIDTRYK